MSIRGMGDCPAAGDNPPELDVGRTVKAKNVRMTAAAIVSTPKARQLVYADLADTPSKGPHLAAIALLTAALDIVTAAVRLLLPSGRPDRVAPT